MLSVHAWSKLILSKICLIASVFGLISTNTSVTEELMPSTTWGGGTYSVQRKEVGLISLQIFPLLVIGSLPQYLVYLV
jgi:hypothetical protein